LSCSACRPGNACLTVPPKFTRYVDQLKLLLHHSAIGQIRCVSLGLLNGASQPHPTQRDADLEPFREAAPRERVSAVMRMITRPPLVRGG